MVSTTLNTAKFFKYLKDDNFTGTAYSTNYEVVIDAEIVDWEFRQIMNITFQELVIIKGVDIKSGLIFKGCNFMKGIVFNKVSSTSFNPEFNSYNASVLFSSCQGQFLKFENSCDFERGVKVGKDSEIEHFNFQLSRVKSVGVAISDCKIKHIEVGQSLSAIRISDVEVGGTIRISSCTGDISIINSKIIDSAAFWNIECPNSFTLNHNTFEDTFDISASRIKGFFIHGDTFKRKGNFENRDESNHDIVTSLNEVYITEANFIEGFEFDGMSKELISLTLPLSPNFTGLLRFIGWKIKETKLSGINEGLKLVFKRISFKRLIFIDFSNAADVTFDSSGAENELFKVENDTECSIIASDSNFGPTRFNEFDFDSFDFINIINASFSDIIAINVNWFTEDKIQIESAEIKSSKNFKRKRELYRQIKQSLQSKGNQIDSLTFRAREMRAYRDELKAQEKENQEDKQNGKTTKPDRNYKWTDKLIMTVNQTNNYGLSWWKPVWIAALITLVFYIIQLPLFADEIEYSPACNFEEIKLTLSAFWNHFEVYWQMFNPARRFNSVYSSNDAALLYFLDFLHRLILGVLIFQIIKAFRRLGSK